jgi:hypothetical protein
MGVAFSSLDIASILVHNLQSGVPELRAPFRITPRHVSMRSSPFRAPSSQLRLCHERRCSGALVPPRRRQSANSLVVAAQAVDAGLDENEAEFAVLVLAVALEMLADGDGLYRCWLVSFGWQGWQSGSGGRNGRYAPS